MRDFGARLEESGEFVDAQALTAGGTFVRYEGEGRPPVTDELRPEYGRNGPRNDRDSV